MKFQFLNENAINLHTIWAWAKQLVQDLNKLAGSMQSGGSATPPGMLASWPTATPPLGWLLCDGSGYNVHQYPELYNAIQHTFGGAGDIFNVPDYRDRILMGAGAIVGVGATAGAENVVLTTAQLPAHNHPVTDPGHNHTFTGDPHNHTITDPGHFHANGTIGTTGALAAGTTAGLGNTGSKVTGLTLAAATQTGTIANKATGVTVGNTGSGSPVSVLNPVIGVNMIIKV